MTGSLEPDDLGREGERRLHPDLQFALKEGEVKLWKVLSSIVCAFSDVQPKPCICLNVT